jgi:hypothetical protein
MLESLFSVWSNIYYKTGTFSSGADFRDKRSSLFGLLISDEGNVLQH